MEEEIGSQVVSGDGELAFKVVAQRAPYSAALGSASHAPPFANTAAGRGRHQAGVRTTGSTQ